MKARVGGLPYLEIDALPQYCTFIQYFVLAVNSGGRQQGPIASVPVTIVIGTEHAGS